MSKGIGAGLLVAAAISLAIVVPSNDAVAQGRQKPQKQVSAPASAQRHTSASAPHRATRYPAIGQQVRTLPESHRIIRVDRNSYRYHDGIFYRVGPRGGYVVVQAPLGARVRYLPPGYISFFIGPRHYVYINFTYYLWERETREYIVVEEPIGAESAVVAASESASGEIFVYPNEGQSDEQRDRDRYQCYLWSVEQTGFDPGAADPDGKAGDYRRAISACLEGRGYTVK